MPTLAIHRLDQRPDLIDRVYEVDSAWPEFMGQDPVANALYWQVAGAFPHLCAVAVDEAGAVAGAFPHLCAVAVDEAGAVAATARALAFASRPTHGCACMPGPGGTSCGSRRPRW
jgi:hypothetical protein